jgi:hypothetical protein
VFFGDAQAGCNLADGSHNTSRFEPSTESFKVLALNGSS